FVHRTLTFIYREFDKKVPEQGQLHQDDQDLLDLIDITAKKQAKYIENFQLKDSLDVILSLAKVGNTYLSSHEPWNVIKKVRESAGTTFYVSTQIVNALAIMIQPYLPSTAKKIRRMLNLPETIQDGELKNLLELPIPTEVSKERTQNMATKKWCEEIQEKYRELKTNGKRN
ncbi:class I tRNA ligase family protein, partial [Candidatus Bathyarchaeota archaeon]|nr:class I tRNA ligase family protein [Candidatus Bathyarchaeota archaeon]